MELKDIKVGETYRFINKATGPLAVPEFSGGTALVRAVQNDSTAPFPISVDLARDTQRMKYINVDPEELEVI